MALETLNGQAGGGVDHFFGGRVSEVCKDTGFPTDTGSHTETPFLHTSWSSEDFGVFEGKTPILQTT